ncbi:gamma-glutamyl-gamma-aminobutyrate hydrolase family protein [Nocardia sp. NPDC047038]|uniref:gamma-glutamyl-gamma-aminobutyrate hydrolase family protein n=1 Tax=Nocardia sp. NPDC047038 TaxID=3154338 RepID=UPI0033F1396E
MTVGAATPGTVRPMIGTTGRRVRLRLVDGMDHRYGHLFTDTFMSDFSERIARAGGVPVNLPYDADPDALCHWLSGVVVTGGQDVHPAYWGGDLSVVRDADPRDDPMVHDAERDRFEIALVRAALDRKIPVLGVCRGLQILNVALGGTLIPHLPPGSVEHLSTSPPLTDGADDHKVTFEPGSIAERIFGASAVTNSWHHQAVDRCGTGLIVTGRTADGVVEAVELPGMPVLGVQWHPEWMEREDPALSWIVAEGSRRI